jgi:flavodoxin
MSEYAQLKAFVEKVYEHADNPVEVLVYAKTIDCFLEKDTEKLIEIIELAIKTGFEDDVEDFYDKMTTDTNFADIVNFAVELDFEEETANFVDKMETEYDFNIEAGGKEYRFISKDRVDNIAYDYAIDLIEDCYIDAEMRKSWIYKYFDIDKAAEDVISDGYGNVFGSYDGDYDEFNGFIYMRMN